jgi:hypothetical protein
MSFHLDNSYVPPPDDLSMARVSRASFPPAAHQSVGVRGTTAADEPSRTESPAATASFDGTTQRKTSEATAERLLAPATCATGTSPQRADLRAIIGTHARCEQPARGFAQRVVEDMAQNWPGYTFMGFLAAGSGLAVGAPLLALAGAIAAPIGMGVHVIRDMEHHYGPGADGNGHGGSIVSKNTPD